jgi:phenylalanyl-tRNA synthetase beta chain
MKFSEAWLRQWVNPALDSDDLLFQMTMAGLEVDGTEPVAQGFSGVVVGEILSAEQHPDADKLRVCQVSAGAEAVQVVCGAPNARVGLKTAFAQVGAVLPGNFKIKKAKLRGVESFGMLCSAQELGLGEDADGIMELSHAVGADLAEIAGADLPLDDLTVDVDLTPNRGDCLSLKGLAREVGVLNNLEVTYPKITPVQAASDRGFPVTLEAKAQCPRYLGRVIEGVDLTQPSPGWLTERLRRCGLRSIDPVVDVTNYVLIELGQPMHAFDLDRLDSGITVRMAQGGDTLTLLDGQEVALDPQTLVIADAKGPVAMAGVMGGKDSGVQGDSTNIFLECAFFAPIAIAGTARRYGLHTDASHRYERGVDFQLQRDAMERATQILLDIVGGQPGPLVETVDEDSVPAQAEVSLREWKLNELLGITIDVAQVDQALQRLDFSVAQRQQTDHGVIWEVIAPSHRFDIAIEADLIEEVCRIYGYNNVPVTQPQVRLPLAQVALQHHSERQLRERIAGLGFQEVITYSFVDPKTEEVLGQALVPKALANPMSSEQSVMRTSLLPGLIDAAKRNSARQQDSGRLFEVGLVFRPKQTLEQDLTVGGVMWGKQKPEAWHSDNAGTDFYDVKGVVEELAQWAGLNLTYAVLDDSAMHPGQSAGVLLDGEQIGRVGRLHPQVENTLDVEELYVFELDALAILQRPKRGHGKVSRFPAVRRDIAVVVQQDISAQTVLEVLAQGMGKLCTNITLFDVYQGDGIDSEEKSLAIGLTLQSQENTLGEEEINAAAQTAIGLLEQHCGARLR